MSKNMQIDRSKRFSRFFEPQKTFRKIDFLVLHHVEAISADHAIEQFLQHKVSAHFLIDQIGRIFELVDENDIAYHAGVSFWKGCEGLNKNSIGVEFVNSAPFSKKFEDSQMLAGVELCKYLVAKYKLEVVGHSDVAYNKETGFLDRKQDPSHLFNWKFLAENGVGIFPKFEPDERVIFKLGDRSSEIKSIKQKLKIFGYRVVNLNNEFDLEMQALVRVFNRRFLGNKLDFWCFASQRILVEL
jgi:N-acetylmuramoyl-L-alanine amidase